MTHCSICGVAWASHGADATARCLSILDAQTQHLKALAEWSKKCPVLPAPGQGPCRACALSGICNCIIPPGAPVIWYTAAHTSWIT